MLFEDRLPLQQVEIAVELEQPGGGASDVSDPKNACSIAVEVIFPEVFAWIKKPHGLVGVWVQTVEIGAFVQITARTCESEILLRRGTSMLLCHDVFDVKGGIDFVQHPQTAVFTAPQCSHTNQLSKPGVQNQAALRF